MIGDNAKRSIIDNSREKKWQKRACVRFDGKALEKGDNPGENPNCCYTSGQYTVKYKPVPDSDYFADKPYVIKCDLFSGNKVRFTNYRHLQFQGKTNPKIQWLLDNTTLTPHLIGIAKRHPAMPIPFCFDVLKYCDRLGENETISRFLWEVEDNGNIERMD